MNRRCSQTGKAPFTLDAFYFTVHFKNLSGTGCICPMAHVQGSAVNFRTRFTPSSTGIPEGDQARLGWLGGEGLHLLSPLLPLVGLLVCLFVYRQAFTRNSTLSQWP